MYCPAHFKEERLDILLELISCHPLATIVTQQKSGIVADHIPLLHHKNSSQFGKLVGHVAKSNTLWQVPADRELLVIFQGPSTYISPNWYATKAESGKVVPTWNYAVVHARGKLTATHASEEIVAGLESLTNTHEASQVHPWQVEDAPEEFTSKLVRSIVGIEIEIESLIGKWKVSQNQAPKNRQSVVLELSKTDDRDSGNMAILIDEFSDRRP